jgi:hypothetical protein
VTSLFFFNVALIYENLGNVEFCAECFDCIFSFNAHNNIFYHFNPILLTRKPKAGKLRKGFLVQLEFKTRHLLELADALDPGRAQGPSLSLFTTFAWKK